jgi:hypothetical protein
VDILRRHIHPTCKCVLSQKDPDDSDVCRARPLGPSDSINTGTVDESLEDELASLVLRGCSEDSNGEGSRAKCMPPHRDVIEILEYPHAKGINCACIGFALGLELLNRGRLRRTLSDKNRGVDSDRLVRVRFIFGTDGSCSRNKVGAGEAGRRNAN